MLQEACLLWGAVLSLADFLPVGAWVREERVEGCLEKTQKTVEHHETLFQPS